MIRFRLVFLGLTQSIKISSLSVIEGDG